MERILTLVKKVNNKIWLEYFKKALEEKNKIELNNLILIANDLTNSEKEILKKVINEL
jgi:hypothetical protein